MDTVDGESNAHSGENQSASDVSAERPPRTPLQQRIEAQRAQLLQAHGVLRCLHEVLVHAEGDDAVFYAEAALGKGRTTACDRKGTFFTNSPDSEIWSRRRVAMRGS